MSRNTQPLMSSLLSPGIYKQNQGKLVRQLTGAVIGAVVLFGVWTLYAKTLVDLTSQWRYGIASLAAVLGVWFAYRIVNHPPFADFLIDVEAEMTKVSWPAKAELVRATAVVLVTMILLSSVLFGYDVLWHIVLRATGVLQF